MQMPGWRDVTREFVEERLAGVMVLKPGQELIHVGWPDRLVPRDDEDLFVPRMAVAPWHCAYCGTHFGETRCPECGAGRTRG